MDFTLDYYQEQIRTTLEANNLDHEGRIRVNVFRKDGGLYTPPSNKINFMIQVSVLPKFNKKLVEIELFKDFPIASGLLSTIKTNNKMVNVLGSIFAKENDYQNCILINEKKEVVEALNSNIFLIKGKEVLTPSLESGCLNGIIRKRLIQMLKKHEDFEVHELSISPFDLLKADEVFLTNSIREIQSVDKYRKKKYGNDKTREIKQLFDAVIKN